MKINDDILDGAGKTGDNAREAVVRRSGNEECPETQDDIDTFYDKHIFAERRKYAKMRHALTRDTWVTIIGGGSVLILMGLGFAVILIFREAENVKSYLSLIGSVVTLILGYLLGTRNSQQ